MTAFLEVHDLGKSFRGLQALSGVSFDVAQGQITGVIGPNGAGKTTLFNCIAGALPPTRGTVVLEGVDITGHPEHRLAHVGVARTFQLMRPFASMTVRENVTVACFAHTRDRRVARADAGDVIDRVGLGEWADSPSGELSTGGRKRLELARALALRPRLLLLDEVLAGLVPAEREPVLDLIRGLRAEGVTMLLVEHVMAAVMALSDRILVLHHGELLAAGTPAEVTSDPAVIEAYLGEELVGDVPPRGNGQGQGSLNGPPGDH